MNLLGIVTDYITDKYRGGTKDVSISTVKSDANNETSMNCFSPGFEVNPADGEYIVFTKVKNSESFLVSIGGINQSIEPDTDRGERRIYSVSSDGETIKSIVKLKNDGVLELNGASDSAVLFSELKSSYDGLKGKLNDLITKYNAHIHITTATVGPTAVPGVISPTTSSETPSTNTIDGAESADVKLS